jgi:nucleotide-binding universal stress UspA family protein
MKLMKISDREVSEEARAMERDLKTKTILAPIKIAGGKTLEFAVGLAQRWQANLYVMYVYSGLPRVSGARLIHAVPSVDRERHQRSVDLYKLVDRIRERYPLTFAYFADNDCPAEAIQNVASQLDADMIIVSAHDKGWLARLLLYSDADDIARRSRTPVLVYRPKSKAKAKSPRSLQRESKSG